MKWYGVLASGWLAANLAPIVFSLARSTAAGRSREWWLRCETLSTRLGFGIGGWRQQCSQCHQRHGHHSQVLQIALLAAVTVMGISWFAPVEAALLPAYWWFGMVGVVLVLTDFERFLIPNTILYPGLVVGVLGLLAGVLATGQLSRLGTAMLIGLVTFLLFLGLAVLSRGALGMGDVKLSALLGIFLGFLGWEQMLRGIFLGMLFAGIPALVLLGLGKKRRNDPLPYGPPLLAGAWLAMLI